jgi:hypothetical protein
VASAAALAKEPAAACTTTAAGDLIAAVETELAAIAADKARFDAESSHCGHSSIAACDLDNSETPPSVTDAAVAIPTMMSATLRFAMLTCKPGSSLAFADAAACCRGDGTFVLYNCARIGALLERYLAGSEWPPIPLVADVAAADFASLKDPLEWSIVGALAKYPGVVLDAAGACSDATGGVVHGTPSPRHSGRPLAGVGTQKVAGFLAKLCRVFSQLYGSTRVLNPSKRRTNQTQARILLLMALYEVLLNGLALLGVETGSAMHRAPAMAWQSRI